MRGGAPDNSPFAGMLNNEMLTRSKAETTANLHRLKATLEGQHNA